MWNRTLIATNVGKSTQTSDKVFRTHSKFCDDYCWLYTTKHTTQNAISTRFTLLYNPYNYKLISPFQQLDHCNEYQGFCELNHMSVAWNSPAKLNCPQLKEVETTTMIIHASPTLESYCLEKTKLTISIHHWYTCPAKSECLQSDAICGFSEFVIAPQNCQLKKHKPLKLSRQ